MNALKICAAAAMMLGFAGMASAECNWGSKSAQQTAQTPIIILPEITETTTGS